MRDQFTFYRSYFEAIRRIKKAADRAAIYDAIAEYALNDNAPALSDMPAAIFDLIRPTLDSGRRKAENRIGKIKEQSDNKPTTNQQQTRKEREKEREIEGELEVEREREYECTPPIIPLAAKPRVRFVPPTVEEVAAYCIERGNKVDAQAFVDFYGSKGWKIGSSAMKDWKAAVRTWERRKDGEKGGWSFDDF